MPDISQLTDQWATIRPYLKQRPAWVSGDDSDRIAAYWLYQMMYWTVPDAFKLIQRGSESKPIYVPAAKTIVETLHRYLAPKLKIIADPNMGTTSEQEAANIVVTSLMRRENFYSVFSASKRYGIMRGDWMFHILADPEREEGARLSIISVDPSVYFPVYDPDNVHSLIGVDLAEPVKDENGNDFIYKLSYRKTTGKGGPSPISVEEAIFKVDKSGLPGVEQGLPEMVVRPLEELDPLITQIPVYHLSNFRDGESQGWGSSELRGIERVLGAINQGISDEELTLALEGLGVYVTDAGTPVDETTNTPIPWNIGPGRVVEVPNGKKFERVTAHTTMAPYQEHLKYLHAQVDGAAPTPAIAKGNVDVQLAESGIALALHLAPILTHAEEKELDITGVLTNMFYDLGTMWLPAYEQVGLGGTQLIPVYGDKVPVNREKRFDEVIGLYNANLVSGAWARSEMSKLGYAFPDDTTMMTQILDEMSVVGQVQADAFGQRLDAELARGVEPSGSGA